MTRYPEIKNFVDCWINQDIYLIGSDLRSIIEEYYVEASIEERQKLLNEIRCFNRMCVTEFSGMPVDEKFIEEFNPEVNIEELRFKSDSFVRDIEFLIEESLSR